MRVIAIIPAFNEAKNIVPTAKSVMDKNIDVIVINDASQDETEAECIKNGIPFISLCNNLGIGGAVQCGYKYALAHKYDIAFQFDGDGQHDINSINTLVEPIVNDEADFVIGSRFLGQSTFLSTKLRRIGIKWLSIMIRLLSGKKVSDPTSGYRVANARIIKYFAQCYPVDFPEPESTMWLLKKGYRVTERPASMFERKNGQSSIRMLDSVYYIIKVSLALLITKG
ncbi:MAG: glycosyltransferase family 2 protein [Defluviitaleaceae bacterium]|nr:glycosyltransferase family 2 protein [Defluviitaleaceae bacterium]MCL2273781.1 glycosyltransferase family 2 protein [Defluviitaleaceae bacterium]